MERRNPFMQNVKVGGPNTIFDIKVMLCYLLNTLNKPISAENLLNVMMSQELVNYFEYESAMAELVNGGQVEKFTHDDEDFYKISEQGASIVVELESSLSASLKSRVVEAAVKLLAYRQNERENKADIIEVEGGYNLVIEIPGHPQPLCKIELFFPERLQAQMARDGFLNDPTLTYTAILSAVTGDRTTLITALSK